MNEEYTTSSATNIEKMWRDKYAYIPASELPEIKAKHEMFKRFGRDNSKDSNGQS